MPRPITLDAGRFFGRVTRERSSGGVRFVESTYAPGTRLPSHAHESAHFCFVLEGGYTEVLRGVSCERTPLDLVYHPPELTHAETHGDRAGRHLMVEVDAGALTCWSQVARAPRDPVELGDPAAKRLGTRLARELATPDDLSPLALEGLVLELLAATSRADRAPCERRAPAWLGLVEDILREEFRAPPRVHVLAAEAGVHPVHLARIFRRYQGCTIAERVRALRVRFAARLLLEGELPLAEVADAAGFADQSHLGRAFRCETGVSPGRYRRELSRRRG